MDAERIMELLEQRKSLVQTLTTSLIKVMGTTSISQPALVISIPAFENFEPKTEKFTRYVDRFKNFLACKNVADEKKKSQLLLASIGSSHYGALAAYLGLEKKIGDLSYADLVKNFKVMLTPLRSAIVSQHYFLTIAQKEGQPVAEFVADLRRDIVDCEFTVDCECKKKVPVDNIFLRAQFIRGLRDSWLREQLLQSGLTKFDDIVAKAISCEASKIEAEELKVNPQPAPSSTKSTSFGDTNQVKGKSNQYQNRRNNSRYNSSRQDSRSSSRPNNRSYSSNRYHNQSSNRGNDW